MWRKRCSQLARGVVRRRPTYFVRPGPLVGAVRFAHLPRPGHRAGSSPAWCRTDRVPVLFFTLRHTWRPEFGTPQLALSLHLVDRRPCSRRRAGCRDGHLRDLAEPDKGRFAVVRQLQSGCRHRGARGHLRSMAYPPPSDRRRRRSRWKAKEDEGWT